MGHGAMDQHDGFAFVEVFRGGFVCVCVCVCVCFLLGGLIGNGGLECGFLPLYLSSFFSSIWVL